MAEQTQRAKAIKPFLTLWRDGINAGGDVANSDQVPKSDNGLVEKEAERSASES